MNNPSFPRLLLLSLLLMLAAGVTAGGIPQGRQMGEQYRSALPQYYPHQFERTGVLQRIENKDHQLLINAKRYKLDQNVRIHTLRTQFGSIRSLRENMEIGFKLHSVHDAQGVISEIWVLPPNSVELH